MRPVNLFLALVVALAAVALHQPRVTYACSCVPPGPPAEASAGAAAVFAGKVSAIGTSPTDSSVLVTFDLSQSWKGPQGPQVTLATSGSSASCGYSFTQGEEYLVYAFAQDGRLTTGLCTRTAALAGAGEDLAALGAGTPVGPAPAPITEDRSDIPWFPILLGGGALLAGAVLFGPGLLRRRR